MLALVLGLLGGLLIALSGLASLFGWRRKWALFSVLIGTATIVGTVMLWNEEDIKKTGV